MKHLPLIITIVSWFSFALITIILAFYSPSNETVYLVLKVLTIIFVIIGLIGTFMLARKEIKESKTNH